MLTVTSKVAEIPTVKTNPHNGNNIYNIYHCISLSFDVTVSIPIFDGVLPAKFTATHRNMPEVCSFLTERRTKYEMLSFLIRVGFKRSELSFSQVVSGRGEPVAAHSKMAVLPSSTATSSGWIENVGFQITVVKNDSCLIIIIE